MGSLSVQWYGLLITIGMIVALVVICASMKRIGLHADDGVELFLWTVPLGVVCARLLYVLVRPDYYFASTAAENFQRVIDIRSGGLTIIGGVLGGLVGIAIFAYRHRKTVNYGQCLDSVVVPVLLAQAIGRVGNFINQEAFGVAITNTALQKFPFAIWIDDPSGVSGEYYSEVWSYITGNGGGYWFAATFFYELVWNLVGAAIFFAIWRKNKKVPGILAFCYLSWECLIRALLEFIRVDAVPVTQELCFTALPFVAAFGAIYALYRVSKVSYNKMCFINAGGIAGQVKISAFDVKNYEFVAKLINGKTTPFASFVAKRYEAGMKKVDEQANYVCYVRQIKEN